jgi:phosphomannomutase
MPDLDAIFKAYDVRGTVPDQLDAELCRRIGAAFAKFLKESEGAARALVARDMRPSGVELAASFAEGVQTQGLDVVDLGLASTDLVYFASGHLDAPGAMFTASHNPAGYNGIKMCLAGAGPIGEDTGLAEIKRLTATGVPAAPTEPGRIESMDLLGDFAEHVRSFVDVGALSPLKVVADTANGMGGLVVPRVFDGLPFDLEVIYPELDGTFPNHPADPIQPENLRDLQARVRDVGADVGLAFDGDADRVFLVDDRAEPLSGSTTTAIVARGILEREPGATILHNLICSKAVPEVIRENGGVPVRTRVGHSFIKSVMAETGAAFGGEHSAHYYFRDNYRADSGSIAALVVLEQISKAGVPLSELRRPFDRYAASGEINFRVDDPAAVIERVADAYAGAQQDRVDGLTVDAGDWWFNLRPSNTEPLLRLNLEAPTRDACDSHVAEVRALVTRPSSTPAGATAPPTAPSTQPSSANPTTEA